MIDGRASLNLNLRTSAGLTLIELILSMAVLSMLAALVLPPMASMLDDRELNRGADRVMIELQKTRLDSMRQGRIHCVTATSGNTELLVRSIFIVGDAITSNESTPSALAAGASSGLPVAAANDDPIANAREIALPNGVSVKEIRTLQSTRSMQSAQDIRQFGQSGLGEAGVSAESMPLIYFYPDGEASDAVIDLISGQGDQMRIVMRGLTGQCDVVDIAP